MQTDSLADLLIHINALISKRDLAQAILLLSKTIHANPRFYQGWLLLSKCLFLQGDTQKAIQLGIHAETVDPLQSDFQTIQQLITQNSLNKAQQLAQRMLHKQPGHPRAIFTLAHTFGVQQRVIKSVEILEQGILSCPANLMLRQLLISHYEQAGNYSQAIESARVLYKLNDSFETLKPLLTMLLKYGQYESLLELIDKAEKAVGNDKSKLSQLAIIHGHVLRILGKRDQSIKAFHQSLSNNPLNAEAWWALSDFKNYDFTQSQRLAISQVLHNANISAEQKAFASFAYAKACESIGSESVAIQLYHDANQRASNKLYNTKQIDAEFTKRKSAYTRKSMTAKAKITKTQPIPIFIVGLPRSGSTMLEQMLASHSNIQATIEQPSMAAIERQAQSISIEKYGLDLFDGIGQFSSEELNVLGTNFIDNGALFRMGNEEYFIDKQPFNFRLVGLISKILPQAIIIDIRRNPLDCGLSLYKQYFPSGVDFSYHLSNIGHFYKAYVELMQHWHKHIQGKVLQVNYEELVESPKHQLEKIFKHIGLEFEHTCLTFHSNNQKIHTTSSEQVRQPINSKGIGQWKKLEKELEPLKQSLGKELLTSLMS
jgi:tetratricopeptide (TPR) repeat protein